MSMASITEICNTKIVIIVYVNDLFLLLCLKNFIPRIIPNSPNKNASVNNNFSLTLHFPSFALFLSMYIVIKETIFTITVYPNIYPIKTISPHFIALYLHSFYHVCFKNSHKKMPFGIFSTLLLFKQLFKLSLRIGKILIIRMHCCNFMSLYSFFIHCMRMISWQ